MNLIASVFSRSQRALSWLWCLVVSFLLLSSATFAQPGIYTCKDKFGRTITSDRPIIECAEAGQRILNADGSTKSVILTPEQERRMRQERAERDADADKTTERRRRERNLMQRYPNEAVWERNALETMIEPFKTIDAAQKRQIEFNKVAEQQKEEAEFYKTNKMPALLRRQIEENRYAIEAENRLIENKRGEVKVIQARLTAELVELRRLWADRGR
jgi:Domain of unknown function (DUF4124)